MKTCPVCKNHIEGIAEKCPHCGGTIIDECSVKTKNNLKKSMELDNGVIEVVGDILEGVLEAVIIDGLT